MIRRFGCEKLVDQRDSRSVNEETIVTIAQEIRLLLIGRSNKSGDLKTVDKAIS